jgi:drug/metabolite transporter (DMT)-like permease
VSVTTARADWAALPPNLRGTLLLLLACAIFTIEVSAGRALGGVLPTEQIVLVRSASQLMIVIPFVLATGQGLGFLRTRHLNLHLLRGAFSIAGLYLYFYSVGHMPIAEATTISFTKALFIVPLAVLVLGERAGPARWIAALIGFAGVLLVARPTLDGISLPALAGMLGALTGAGLLLVTKMLTAHESPLTIMVFVALTTTSVALIPGVLAWQRPEGEAFWWLVAIGLAGPLGQYISISAYRIAEASALAPVDYVRLIYGTAAGFLIFAEIPDAMTLAGAAVIVVTTLFLARHEARPQTPRKGN